MSVSTSSVSIVARLSQDRRLPALAWRVVIGFHASYARRSPVEEGVRHPTHSSRNSRSKPQVARYPSDTAYVGRSIETWRKGAFAWPSPTTSRLRVSPRRHSTRRTLPKRRLNHPLKKPPGTRERDSGRWRHSRSPRPFWRPVLIWRIDWHGTLSYVIGLSEIRTPARRRSPTSDHALGCKRHTIVAAPSRRYRPVHLHRPPR